MVDGVCGWKRNPIAFGFEQRNNELKKINSNQAFHRLASQFSISTGLYVWPCSIKPATIWILPRFLRDLGSGLSRTWIFCNLQRRQVNAAVFLRLLGRPWTGLFLSCTGLISPLDWRSEHTDGKKHKYKSALRTKYMLYFWRAGGSKILIKYGIVMS